MTKTIKTAIVTMIVAGAVAAPGFSKSISKVTVGDLTVKIGAGVLFGLPDVDVELTADEGKRKAPKQAAPQAKKPAPAPHHKPAPSKPARRDECKPAPRYEPKPAPKHEPKPEPKHGKGNGKRGPAPKAR